MEVELAFALERYGCGDSSGWLDIAVGAGEWSLDVHSVEVCATGTHLLEGERKLGTWALSVDVELSRVQIVS